MQWSLLNIGLYLVVWPSKAELWEKDMSKEVYIEASVEGLKGKVSHEHRESDEINLKTRNYWFS